MDEKKEVVTTKKKNELTTRKDGSLDLTPIQSKLILATQLIENKMISDTFKSPQQILVGMEYCNALGLKEIVGLNQMYLIKGKPSLYGDAPLMLVQSSGELDSFKEFFIDYDCNEICVKNKNINSKIYASITQVKRKGDPEIQEDFFSTEELEVSGISIGKYGEKDVWKKFQKNMMRYKARSMALKSKFADVLNGVNIAEYNDHFSPDFEDINNPNEKKNQADEIREEIKNQKETKDKAVKVIDKTTITKNHQIEDVIETTSEKLFPHSTINKKEEEKIKDPVLAKIQKEMNKTPIKTRNNQDERPSFKLEG